MLGTKATSCWKEGPGACFTQPSDPVHACFPSLGSVLSLGACSQACLYPGRRRLDTWPWLRIVVASKIHVNLHMQGHTYAHEPTPPHTDAPSTPPDGKQSSYPGPAGFPRTPRAAGPGLWGCSCRRVLCSGLSINCRQTPELRTRMKPAPALSGWPGERSLGSRGAEDHAAPHLGARALDVWVQLKHMPSR